MFEKETVRALSFDCYGTLIDWEKGILSALQPWLKRVGSSLPEEAILTAFAETEPQVQKDTPDSLYPDILREVVKRLGFRLGFDIKPEEVKAFARSVPDWPRFPDTVDALQRLKKHYKMFILSNIDRQTFAETRKKLGILFDGVYTAQDIGAYKPDPKAFAYLIEKLRNDFAIGPDRHLHVAQSLFHDHVPAKEAGLNTCWIDRRQGLAGGATLRPGKSISPDLVFPDMKSLADYLTG